MAHEPVEEVVVHVLVPCFWRERPKPVANYPGGFQGAVRPSLLTYREELFIIRVHPRRTGQILSTPYAVQNVLQRASMLIYSAHGVLNPLQLGVYDRGVHLLFTVQGVRLAPARLLVPFPPFDPEAHEERGALVPKPHAATEAAVWLAFLPVD